MKASFLQLTTLLLALWVAALSAGRPSTSPAAWFGDLHNTSVAAEYPTLEFEDTHLIFASLIQVTKKELSTFMAAAGSAPSSGIPLSEYRRDTPPGWAPNLPDYPLKLYLEKLKLWYRVYDGPDEAVGPLIAGRLSGQAQKLAMRA